VNAPLALRPAQGRAQFVYGFFVGAKRTLLSEAEGSRCLRKWSSKLLYCLRGSNSELQRPAHDGLRLLHDAVEVRLAGKALGIQLVNVFSARWSCCEPAVGRDDLQPADGRSVAGRLRQLVGDGITRQCRRGDRRRREFEQRIFLRGRG